MRRRSEPAFASWREFRDAYLPAVLGGMTVNERLDALSLMDEYDRAVENRDVDSIRAQGFLRRESLMESDLDSLKGQDLLDRMALEVYLQVQRRDLGAGPTSQSGPRR